MKITVLALLFAACCVASVRANADPGSIWGPGGATNDPNEWVCKPVKGNPDQQRCTRR